MLMNCKNMENICFKPISLVFIGVHNKIHQNMGAIVHIQMSSKLGETLGNQINQVVNPIKNNIRSRMWDKF